MASGKVTSLEECIALCDAALSCVDVSLSGSACYLKRDLSPGVSAPGMIGARLVTQSNQAPPETSSVTTSPTSSITTAAASATSSTVSYLSCPESDSSVYTATNGERFQIECDIDHAGADLTMVQMSGTGRSWLTKCVETCANATGCVDVSLSGNACYLKSQLRAAHPVPGIFGARLLTAANTTLPPAKRPFSPALVGKFEYLACYNDTPTSRSLDGAFMYGSSEAKMTVERCSHFCGNYTLFGVENAQECYCGSTLRSTVTQQSPDACGIACAGNTTELCGGGGAISVNQLRDGYNPPAVSSVTSLAPSTISPGNATVASSSTVPSSDGLTSATTTVSSMPMATGLSAGASGTISGFPMATGTNSTGFGNSTSTSVTTTSVTTTVSGIPMATGLSAGASGTISGFPMATGTNSTGFGSNGTVVGMARRQPLVRKKSKHGRKILGFMN